MADRRLRFVDPGHVVELALAVANHRLEKVQERYGAQLDAGDLALVSVEGETLDRAARIAKLVADLNFDWRRARIAHEQGTVIKNAMDRALVGTFPDVTQEERDTFARVLVEDLTHHEMGPSELLDGSKGDR